VDGSIRRDFVAGIVGIMVRSSSIGYVAIPTIAIFINDF